MLIMNCNFEDRWSVLLKVQLVGERGGISPPLLSTSAAQTMVSQLFNIIFLIVNYKRPAFTKCIRKGDIWQKIARYISICVAQLQI